MLAFEDEFAISTDKSRLDIDAIHRFLSEESYWAATRTKDQTAKAIENSLCFGVFHDTHQIGFARVVSDRATFAYIGDVFILNDFRGRGLSKRLMQTIIEHPELQNLRRWLLATRDAHGLYSKFGFEPLNFPERWMELSSADGY
ncbi:MAG: GNAT family N-acetyltransferase [Pyrinomonadaceae bacterium]